MSRAVVLPVFAILALSVLATPASAQSTAGKKKQSSNQQDYVVVERWFSLILNSRGGISEQLGGPFETYKQASDRSNEWSKAHPNDLRIPTEKKLKVRIHRPKPEWQEKRPSEQPSTPSGSTGSTPQVPAKGTITVRVYKLEGRKWVEQPKRKFETKSDYDRAVKYYKSVQAASGWKATWNAPGWPKPGDGGEQPTVAEPYNPPKPVDVKPLASNADMEARLVGTWDRDYPNEHGGQRWGVYHDTWVFRPDKTAERRNTYTARGMAPSGGPPILYTWSITGSDIVVVPKDKNNRPFNWRIEKLISDYKKR